jgi:hypothetical protein
MQGPTGWSARENSDMTLEVNLVAADIAIFFNAIFRRAEMLSQYFMTVGSIKNSMQILSQLV